MERAISASAWEVNCSSPWSAQSTKMRCSWGACCLSSTPRSEPGQGTKPGHNHWLRLLPRVIFLTQVLWASGGAQAQGGCQGSSWGCSCPFRVGAHWSRTMGWWEHRCWCSSLSPPPWLDTPSFHPSLMLVVWLERQAGSGQQVTLPLWAHRYQLCGCGLGLPISVIENSAGSQKLPTAALLMTGVVVLGNSLGCLWVSSLSVKRGWYQWND